ncbi:MAG: hypothetical protein U9P11_03145 [Pseudomonadota bacterium]|nr:hypothetical protein [Pseudomonadota bacterium]
MIGFAYTRIRKLQVVTIPYKTYGVEPMKKSLPAKLLTIALLSAALNIGCAGQQSKDAAGTSSKASSEATAAITDASDAIAAANANKWIWRDTEKFLQQAQEAANQGDNATAIKLANKAKAQADDAVIQYNYEKDHPRGL